jgi:glutamyl-tRNA reductase
MKVQVLGCSHHSAPVAVRERLAFSADQARSALGTLRREFPESEAVLLSTCNRVELYVASQNGGAPTVQQAVEFLARFHDLDPTQIVKCLYDRDGVEAVRHLFMVASSLDSMVVGEPQILCQVKQAYQLAIQQNAVGPLTHAAFQAAVKAARRVALETSIHQRRISIPSVAVADFAHQVFERFNDKHILVIGAGEMAAETLRYLRDEGATQVTVVNRSAQRATELAQQWNGRVQPWGELLPAIAAADLVISTTGATEPIVTLEHFASVERLRHGRPLLILDLAVPRDFDPAIGSRPVVFLCSIDDLQQVCERNRREREKELPAAMRIIDQETGRFLADLHQRAVGPIIRQLRLEWQKLEEAEVTRLFHKLPKLDEPARDTIRQAFDRLLSKLLHPPLESLRGEARHGIPGALLEAMARLFQLKD